MCHQVQRTGRIYVTWEITFNFYKIRTTYYQSILTDLKASKNWDPTHLTRCLNISKLGTVVTYASNTRQKNTKFTHSIPFSSFNVSRHKKRHFTVSKHLKRLTHVPVVRRPHLVLITNLAYCDQRLADKAPTTLIHRFK